MLVKTQRDGLARTGLHVGEANARRYFSKGAPSIELRLDDLHIQCTLSPDFWQGRPEIHDPRLSIWLEFKAARRTAARDSIQLAMVPSGSDTFILRPAHEARNEAFGSEVGDPGKPHIEKVLPHRSTHAIEELSVA